MIRIHVYPNNEVVINGTTFKPKEDWFVKRGIKINARPSDYFVQRGDEWITVFSRGRKPATKYRVPDK